MNTDLKCIDCDDDDKDEFKIQEVEDSPKIKEAEETYLVIDDNS